jgi:hypothetical protein
MEVGDERGVRGEGGIAAEDMDLRAETAEFGDRVLYERFRCELQKGFVRTHAGTAAASEHIAGDRKSVAGWS